MLLLLGAALHDGAGEDLGAGDQRAARAERAPRELLGGDAHREVVGVAAGREAAVLLGHREAEAADLGHAVDDLSGMSSLCRWMCSATGRILSSANRWNVSRTRSKSSSRCAGPVPCCGSSSASASRNAGERCSATKSCAPESIAGSTPHSPRGRRAGRDVGDRVGDVRVRELRLEVAVLGVVEHHAGRGDGAGRVGEVVGHDLVLVERAHRDAAVDGRSLGEAAGRGVDEGARRVDGRAGGGIRVRHGGGAYRRRRRYD